MSRGWTRLQSKAQGARIWLTPQSESGKGRPGGDCGWGAQYLAHVRSTGRMSLHPAPTFDCSAGLQTSLGRRCTFASRMSDHQKEKRRGCGYGYGERKLCTRGMFSVLTHLQEPRNQRALYGKMTREPAPPGTPLTRELPATVSPYVPAVPVLPLSSLLVPCNPPSRTIADVVHVPRRPFRIAYSEEQPS